MHGRMRYGPWPGFGSLRHEIDRIFDQMTGEGEDQSQPTMWTPRADMGETDTGYVIRMDVPGLAREHLTIELHDDRLTVSGERKAEQDEQNEKMHRVERAYGRFFRTFTLPQAGDTENVHAALKDGVLTVRVSKRTQSQPRRVEVL